MWAMILMDLSITIDFSKSTMNVESVEVRMGKLHSPIEREAGNSWRRTFSPPMELSHGDTFYLQMRYTKWFGMKTKHKDIIFNPEYIFCQVEQSVSSGKGLELQPTTSEIFWKCPWLTLPRFQILVIGKTGVGKSSLISHVFRVEEMLISHVMPGKADIDTEFISRQNERFVLHDSKGFEPGEGGSLKIVQDFIDRRNIGLTKIYGRLCLQIPRAGSRLLETGTEEFLKDGKTLGNIPIVVVLTKYDMLIDDMELNLNGTSVDGLSNDAIRELTKNKAEAKLQDICIGPLKEFARRDIPYAKISSSCMPLKCNTAAHKDHKETLTRLIEITENCINQHSAPEAAVMTSIAQQVHPGLKIDASIHIRVGKRRYWKALASSTTFKNRKTWDCLHVLHTDIVNVWNFYDPHLYLQSQEFRELMVKMVDKLETGPTPNPTKTITIGLSMVGTIAGIVSALAGPVAPIVVPIAASAVLTVWVHNVYQISYAPPVFLLQRFMSYIVHLTLVLQTLYLVSESQELTCRSIKLAVASYLASPMSGEVHTWIQEYDRQLTILERVDRDTLDKIIEVIQLYSIDAEQMSRLRENIPSVGSLPDEPWEIEMS
ncbi:hypothetical protein DFJ58DRAFT_840324 [Suillus subalutaceus]|uniref:uncharacterized protein n=1 Tax=Suillus subalutaceus TaxID=48586 RepID=UPI001B85FB9E|nr:uncharacterized protein DFJ58DRAFT_840324 [Suillus subalutaceus]KAG1858729.1 hypothetical protein DFJ58DRAFT_840324 [Suillus subalutaceus]